jgi:hypothetical protein
VLVHAGPEALGDEARCVSLIHAFDGRDGLRPTKAGKPYGIAACPPAASASASCARERIPSFV